MDLPAFLIRLLIGVLVWFIGEKIIALVKNADLVQILNIVLLIVIVLFVIFGSVLPITIR
jgi:hypothetical protein